MTALEIQAQKKLRRNLFRTIVNGNYWIVFTVPLIYGVAVPALLLDAFATAYQYFSFPIFGIRRVQRRDYFVFDRGRLTYLNALERLNCTYCSYFNGLVAYLGEIGARTEQFWCPIRHSLRVKGRHPRASQFAPHGDAEAYQKKLPELRAELSKEKVQEGIPATDHST